MENEDMVKLITMISTLGYKVVTIGPETFTEGNTTKPQSTGRYSLVIQEIGKK